MDNEELERILAKHRQWTTGKKDGKRANLRDADLRYADLRGANLYKANLRGADLRGADLCNADLSGTYLSGADLRGASLRGANLCGADLRGTGVMTFQYERWPAIWNGERLQIGCHSFPVTLWKENYRQIGEENGYTDIQIKAYGTIIHMIDRLLVEGEE